MDKTKNTKLSMLNGGSSMATEIKTGDCTSVLKTLEANTFNTCVTSPPYWGLRDYGEDAQLGLEQTPEEYVENMVKVFSEVKRVLRDDGTLWLNLGDSYYNYRQGKGQYVPKQTVSKTRQDLPMEVGRRANKLEGLKEKDLVGIPWRVAFALQADGWYLRQDIIWNKPNPMPESVRDRCTKAHEYIFLLSKNKKYYYDNEAIKEPTVTKDNSNRNRDITKLNNTPGRSKMKGLKTNNYDKRNKRSVWSVSPKPYKEAHFATYPPDLIEPCILAGCPKDGHVLDPFGGAGTTAIVADRNDRNCTLIELNSSYVKMANDRIGNYVMKEKFPEQGRLL